MIWHDDVAPVAQLFKHCVSCMKGFVFVPRQRSYNDKQSFKALEVAKSCVQVMLCFIQLSLISTKPKNCAFKVFQKDMTHQSVPY